MRRKKRKKGYSKNVLESEVIFSSCWIVSMERPIQSLQKGIVYINNNDDGGGGEWNQNLTYSLSSN